MPPLLLVCSGDCETSFTVRHHQLQVLALASALVSKVLRDRLVLLDLVLDPCRSAHWLPCCRVSTALVWLNCKGLRFIVPPCGDQQHHVCDSHKDSFLTQPSLRHGFAVGEDVRRYMAGPPGPQGPPGPPGSAVGISASYSVDEIALHLFNIMNGRCRMTLSLKDQVPGQTAQIPLLPFFRSRDR